MRLLNKQDLVDIEAAIARAESRSAGELVVAVLGRSDDYVLPRALCTAVWTVALALLAALLRFKIPAVVLISLQVPLAALLWMFWSWPPILRMLLARRDTLARVQQRAMQMFAERGVHYTRDHSGLLILISELEHQVVIVGDRGIHAQVGTVGWETYVQKIVTGIRQKHLKPALLEVIDQLGTILAEKFPPRPDDRNELPNQVLTH